MRELSPENRAVRLFSSAGRVERKRAVQPFSRIITLVMIAASGAAGAAILFALLKWYATPTNYRAASPGAPVTLGLLILISGAGVVIGVSELIAPACLRRRMLALMIVRFRSRSHVWVADSRRVADRRSPNHSVAVLLENTGVIMCFYVFIGFAAHGVSPSLGVSLSGWAASVFAPPLLNTTAGVAAILIGLARLQAMIHFHSDNHA